MDNNNKSPTPAQRKTLERQRKRDKGLVPKEIWVFPEYWDKIQKYIKILHENS